MVAFCIWAKPPTGACPTWRALLKSIVSKINRARLIAFMSDFDESPEMEEISTWAIKPDSPMSNTLPKETFTTTDDYVQHLRRLKNQSINN
jgi:hypothetical protein